jgi:hypothetical protein
MKVSGTEKLWSPNHMIRISHDWQASETNESIWPPLRAPLSSFLVIDGLVASSDATNEV